MSFLNPELPKHLISTTFTFLFAALLISKVFASRNSVGTITSSWRHTFHLDRILYCSTYISVLTTCCTFHSVFVPNPFHVIHLQTAASACHYKEMLGYLKPFNYRTHHLQRSPKHRSIHSSYHTIHVHIKQLRRNHTTLDRSSTNRKPLTHIHSK